MDDERLEPFLIQQSIPFGSFSETVTHPSFLSLFISDDKDVQNYIIQHFDQILQLAFRITRGKKASIIASTQIIKNCKYPFLNRLYTETNLINFLTNYPFRCRVFKPASHHLYFLLLHIFIYTQNDSIVPSFATRNYFESLLEISDLYPAYSFIIDAIRDQRYATTLQNINFSQSVFNFLGVEALHDSCMSILTIGMENPPFNYQIADVLQKTNALRKMIDICLKDIDPDTIKFIKYTVQAYVKKRSVYRMQRVFSYIQKYQDKFCDTVSGQKFFTRATEDLAIIALTIAEEEHIVSPSFERMLYRLSEDFFVFQNNSILHSLVVNIFKVLSDCGLLTQSVVKASGIGLRIVDAYLHKKNDVTISYWGHTRELSLIINRFDVTQFGIDRRIWDSAVMGRVTEEKNIIHRDYGGYTPRFNITPAAIDQIVSVSLIFLTFLGIMWIFRKRIQ